MLCNDIRKIIKSKRITRDDILRNTDLSPQMMIRLITGEEDDPPLSVLRSLARGLGVSLSELLDPSSLALGDGSGLRKGVLISEYYGVGWGTENGLSLATDPRIVKKWVYERPSKREMKRFIKSLGYKGWINMAAYDKLSVQYIPKGARYRIVSDNGFEELIIEGEGEWQTA